MRICRPVVLALLASVVAAPLAAQELSEQPITRYVADLHAALPKVPGDDNLAKPYGLAGTNLPGLGLGVDVGAHLYPLRWKAVTFGVGLSGVFGRSHASPIKQSDGSTIGKDVTARFSAIAPQLSFNFGSAAGWSYLSGGLGSARLELRTPDTPPDTVWPRRKTINYGGGGRWFIRDRMAVTFDVRFYAMNPVPATPNTLQSPRLRMLVISIGVSLR
jgi:hypothetical protein